MTNLETFRDEALSGLRAPRKSIPCKYFYDAAGSRLFERICELEEYYPTRTELLIMHRHATEMAACLGERCLLVEYWSGSGMKTRILLDHLVDPAGYVPIDIAREQLEASAIRLGREHPGLEVLPICADYLKRIDLPETSASPTRRAVFFPGSTIGNFAPPDAEAFFRRNARLVGPGGGLLIGVDLKKDPETLERAYDDAEGVTAAFNKNLLARMNRELGADFDLDAFDHHAPYNREEGRIEVYLVSRKDHSVQVAGETIEFTKGEAILTEYSYKYAPEEFEALLARGGMRVTNTWADPARLFTVMYAIAS